MRLIRPKRLPKVVRDAGVALVERKPTNSTVSELVSISDDDWHVACRRFNATLQLPQHCGGLRTRVTSIAKMFGVTARMVRRWLSIYRKNPVIVALLPKPRGHGITALIESNPALNHSSAQSVVSWLSEAIAKHPFLVLLITTEALSQARECRARCLGETSLNLQANLVGCEDSGVNDQVVDLIGVSGVVEPWCGRLQS